MFAHPSLAAFTTVEDTESEAADEEEKLFFFQNPGTLTEGRGRVKTVPIAVLDCPG